MNRLDEEIRKQVRIAAMAIKASSGRLTISQIEGLMAARDQGDIAAIYWAMTFQPSGEGAIKN